MDGSQASRRSLRQSSSRLLASLVCLMLAGCSVMMASKAPGRKDMNVLTPGVSRSRIVAELGQPLQSRKTPDGGAKDVFAFKQGYTTGTKAGRAIFHGLADLNTLFLWELAATPLESSMQGEDVRVEVQYDNDELARRIEYFSGAHLAHGEPSLPGWLRRKEIQQTAVIGDSSHRGPGSDEGIRQAGGSDADRF